MLQIVLNHLAARHLFQLTRDYTSARAWPIFIDDELIGAPMIFRADPGGELRIVGKFSQKKLEGLAAGLNAHALP